jgi:hypothetical protein
VRAALYAGSRGEADYAAMTMEVARALDQLATVTDPVRRLQLAQEARRRLLTWSRDHYDYRATDIQQLASLFDEVMASLRAAAGESTFSLELSRGSARPTREPLMADASAPESLHLARAAAAAADVAEERLAVLRTAAAKIAPLGRTSDIGAALAADLAAEERAASSYARLTDALLSRAGLALSRGDAPAVRALQLELIEQDKALGRRRAREVEALAARLDRVRDAAERYRLALDHYAFARTALLRYERRVRPSLAGLARLTPVLTAVRDMRSVGVERLDAGLRDLRRYEAALAALSPPDALSGVHSSIIGTLRMTAEALSRRRQAIVTNRIAVAREASSAAAGALLLGDVVRRDLVAGLYPPPAPELP